MDLCIVQKSIVVVLPDAEFAVAKVQLCVVAWLLIEEVQTGTIYVMLPCSSYEFLRPVNLLCLVDIMAHGRRFDRGGIFSRYCFLSFYNNTVPAGVGFDFICLTN